MTCDEIFEKCKTPEECKNAMAALLDGEADAEKVRKAYKKRTFGIKVRRCRIKAGLSMEALAARAGMTVQTIHRMETGKVRRPTKATIRLLCEALDMDAKEDWR